MAPEPRGLKARISSLLGTESAPRVGFSYALRTTTAAVLSLAVCQLLRIENPIWAVVSSVVVILPEVHASVSSAALRVIANLVGATVGVAIAVLGLPAFPSLVIGLAAVVGACRLLGIDMAARTASVAVVIVLLRAPGAVLGSSEVRVLLVILGCGVALAVTIVAAGIERALSRRPG
jgi:uncharacterized membrane protein YgaE (UPF0421/DUF939 family)